MDVSKNLFSKTNDEQLKEEIKNCDVIFVSDFFVEDYVGGAELTTQALIDSSPLVVSKLHSNNINLETLEAGHSKFWIFTNYSQMNLDFIPTIIANLNYAIVEYDYKIL